MWSPRHFKFRLVGYFTGQSHTQSHSGIAGHRSLGHTKPPVPDRIRSDQRILVSLPKDTEIHNI